jgi:hypothetical protein
MGEGGGISSLWQIRSPDDNHTYCVLLVYGIWLFKRDHAYLGFLQFRTWDSDQVEGLWFSTSVARTRPRLFGFFSSVRPVTGTRLRSMRVTCSVHPVNRTYPHLLTVSSAPWPKFWDLLFPIIRSLDITETPTAAGFLPHPPQFVKHNHNRDHPIIKKAHQSEMARKCNQRPVNALRSCPDVAIYTNLQGQCHAHVKLTAHAWVRGNNVLSPAEV